MSKKSEAVTSSASSSSAADSPAKTSAWPVKASESKAPGPDSGPNMRASFASYDRATSSWRTSQRSLLGGWVEYSGTWPRAGTMRRGTVYRQKPSAPITGGIASSLSPGQLPTPTASRYGTGQNGKRGDGTTYKGTGTPSLETMATHGLWPAKPVENSGASDAEVTTRSADAPAEPMPTSSTASPSRMWPTPTVKGNYNRASYGSKSGDGLSTAVGRGPLNPEWVEWLMGFPVGWTGLEH